ncbi:hypothetical protein FA95DRAFT_744656 [Auriscalpium vulgare]|uniref:Uncharacterized protein n=1 Tax=Auriscalpium vulgare TaxID=40419 RepID=A0ACB8SB52_9AGAM|nr:hypothetical protein FA95DRAFT_744656 [Auriscalpium vulgare]
MSNRRRLTTVHDFSALRLHPDGSRVTSEAGPSQPTTQLYPRNKSSAVKDTRGHWIAKDAAGHVGVKKRKRAEADGDGEDFERDVSEAGLDDEETGTQFSEKVRRRKRTRAEKRQAFANNLEFLGSESALLSVRGLSEAPNSEHEPGGRAVPSSDLLKCIHYFASHYYTAHGMLTDKARVYRQEKAERRRQRLEAEDIFASWREDSDEEVDQLAEEDDEDELDVRVLNEDENGEDKEQGEEGRGGEQGGEHAKVGRWLDEKQTGQDMYKVLDGSALMAIGLIFREHVASLVKPSIPPGWEEDQAADDSEGGYVDIEVSAENSGEGTDVEDGDASVENDGSESDESSASESDA